MMTDPVAVESLPGRAARLTIIAVFATFVAMAGLGSLPPLDRDESRFAQATAQMLETGDFINIRFQESERNKKPAGIYWLQAASVTAFSSVEAREIWAYRLPSVAGAIIASIFTYLAGARLYGPATGFLAAILLAAAPGVAGEATIAKTDAVLLATICTAQAAFIHIFAAWKEHRPNSGLAGIGWPIVFWIALGVGILVKGPITPMVVGLTGLALVIRTPRFAWVGAMRPLMGVAILAIMIVPWALAIDQATEGRFFVDAIGGDMLGKVGDAQESHSGPPGYYLALVWILLWPAAALIIPGLARAFATRSAWPSYFLLAWVIPSWLIFEFTATKLPHYTLPLYPALAILAARAAATGAASRRNLARRIGAGTYVVIGLIVSVLIAALPHIYGDGSITPLCYAAAALIATATIITALLYYRGRAYQGGLAAAGLGALAAWTILSGLLPSLDRLMVSPRLSAAIDAAGFHALHDGAPPTALAGYHEPSAVFLLGTETNLTDAAGAAEHLAAFPGSAVSVDASLDEEFREALSELSLQPHALAVIDGVNYSKGRPVRLTIYDAAPQR